MAFRGKEPIRTKIKINDKIKGQLSRFNYLGNDKNCDIDVKLGKFQAIAVCGTINHIFFFNKVRRETKLKLRRPLYCPMICLLYTSRCV